MPSRDLIKSAIERMGWPTDAPGYNIERHDLMRFATHLIWLARRGWGAKLLELTKEKNDEELVTEDVGGAGRDGDDAPGADNG